MKKETMQRKNSPLLLVSIGFLVGFLIFGGILIYKYLESIEKGIGAPGRKIEEKSEGVAIPKRFSDWKVFQDSREGFEIKYPSDWKFEKYSPSVYFFPKVYQKGLYTPIYLELQVKNLENPYHPGAGMREYYIKGRKFYKGVSYGETIYTFLEGDGSEILEATLSIKNIVGTHNQVIKNRSDYPLSNKRIENLVEKMLSFFKFLETGREKEKGEIGIKKEIQLTKTPSNEISPSFSPDGKEIVFLKDGNIWIMDNQGKNLRKITNFEETGNFFFLQETIPTVSFSSDGKKIVFTKDGEIWTIDKDGKNLKQVTFDKRWYKFHSFFNPEGTKIVYSANKNLRYPYLPSGIHVWVVDSNGSNPKILTEHEDNVHPSFSPDGKKIIYSSCVAGNKDIWIMNIDGTHKTQLTSGETDEYFPSFSSDMKRVVFTQGILISSRMRHIDIWVMNVDGTNKRRLTKDEAFEQSPSFSPDGREVIFSSDRAGNYDIWMIEIE